MIGKLSKILISTKVKAKTNKPLITRIVNKEGPISNKIVVSSMSEWNKLIKMSAPTAERGATIPCFTSFIMSPPPKPRPKVNPTTTMVDALCPIFNIFKKGLRQIRIQFLIVEEFLKKLLRL